MGGSLTLLIGRHWALCGDLLGWGPGGYNGEGRGVLLGGRWEYNGRMQLHWKLLGHLRHHCHSDGGAPSAAQDTIMQNNFSSSRSRHTEFQNKCISCSYVLHWKCCLIMQNNSLSSRVTLGQTECQNQCKKRDTLNIRNRSVLPCVFFFNFIVLTTM